MRICKYNKSVRSSYFPRVYNVYCTNEYPKSNHHIHAKVKIPEYLPQEQHERYIKRLFIPRRIKEHYE